VPENLTTSTESTHRGVPIVLKDLTKKYPNQPKAAVDAVNMEIPAGEIVVLVGPSGCGKTTTMRMVNRLIEPTSGTITIGGEDVTKLDDVQLRRKIGYVIQQIGLIPHLSIAQNVALVPKLLKWDKKRITERVDEMLTVVGLDPEQYRSRYPRQLSGGQQQRVGVARALAADPPIMLMDEPFGAVDPITRSRLQDDFVEGFIGAGAALKRLHFERVDSLELGEPDTQPTHDTVDVSSTLHAALDLMVGKGLSAVTVNRDGRPVGTVTMQSILDRAHSGDADAVGA